MTAERDPDQEVFLTVDSIDLRGLPLSPEEAFVLACIQGQSSANDVTVASGLGPERVLAHLERLTQLGVVRRAVPSIPPRSPRATQRPSRPDPKLAEARPGPSPRPQRPGAKTEKIRPQKALGEAKRESPRAPHPAAAPPDVDAAEHQPDASLELDIDLQKRILEVWAKLDTVDHFTLLGVPQSADRKAVKKAYFTLVAVYHPDRYFKKRLGHFTKKIERVFQKMTEAHDTLSDERGRKDYEAYLAAQRRTRALDTGLQDEAELLKQVEQLLQQAQEQARKEHQLAIRAPSVPPPVLVPSMPPPVLPGSPPPWQKPPPPPPKPAAAPVRLVDDPAARRRALARKLGRTAPGPAVTTVTVTAPAPTSAERKAAVGDDLKRRYEQRMLELQRHQIEHYMQVANEALAAGNPVSALNAMRIAAGLAPGNHELMQHRAELEAQVAASMADGYIEQARYEENNGHHLEAARSYTRAAKGKPSADLLRSAAESYLKAGQDLRQAAELARQAVQLAPERSDLRLTLAKVYEAAGMKQSAVKELQRTLEMSPNNAKIKEWLKRLERGGV